MDTSFSYVYIHAYNSYLHASSYVAIASYSGGSRNFGREFPLVIDPRCRGLGAQSPAAEEVLIL